MTDRDVRRAVTAAIVPIVASLAPWGVDEGHWLPDRDGRPVIWLRTVTASQAATLRGQVWLLPQVQITLTRLGVPHEIVWTLRVEVTSSQAQAELFEE
jgi:hypothetical protein